MAYMGAVVAQTAANRVIVKRDAFISLSPVLKA
jgi:hypothetical protein